MPDKIKKENIEKEATNFLSSIFNGIGIAKKQHDFYLEAMKLGAIGNVVSYLISTFFSYLSGVLLASLFIPWFGYFGALPFNYYHGYNLLSILIGLFWSVVLGSIGIVVFIRFILKYWPDFLGKNLFAKLFYLNLILTVLFSGLIGMIMFIFAPVVLLSFVIVLIGGIIASYTSAKIIAGGLERKYPEILKEIMKK